MTAIKNFSTFAAFGSFLLYFFGYLALRFHITALGVVTDLGVLDERYLFAGAHFFVMLAFCLPWLAATLIPLWLAVRFLFRCLPARLRKRAIELCTRPALLLWCSLVLSIVAIQTWLNGCLLVNDLALAGVPADPAWLAGLLRAHDRVDLALFFAGTLLCAAAVCGPVIAASRLPLDSAGMKGLFAIAAILALVCVLLVPVNFGTVVMPYRMDRVETVGKNPVAGGQQAWMLWEGKEWITYFVKSPAGRSLIVVPVKEIDRIEVRGSDSLLDMLAGAGVSR